LRGQVAPGKRDHLTVPLTIGEVQTGLLLTSAAVPVDTAVELLAIVPGGSVRTRQRPFRYAWSPQVLTGVDCSAPLADRREVRIVGTPATQVSLTDGHIVQAGTYATFRDDPAGRRRPWSHYLAQPGVLEVLGKASSESLSTGFLRGPSEPTHLDLGGVNVRALASIQRSDYLDHIPRFRAAVLGCAGPPRRRTAGKISPSRSARTGCGPCSCGPRSQTPARSRTSSPTSPCMTGFCLPCLTWWTGPSPAVARPPN
jgi:hypothetical protein